MEQEQNRAIAKASINRAIKQISWWEKVQDDVKEQVNFIIKHIETLGVPFRDAFRAACKLNEQKRKLLNQTVNSQELSILFGPKLTEEAYRSAKDPTVCLLGLGEWVDLTEADVQACRLLCDHIDILLSYNVLQREKEPNSLEEALKRTLNKKIEE